MLTLRRKPTRSAALERALLYNPAGKGGSKTRAGRVAGRRGPVEGGEMRATEATANGQAPHNGDDRIGVADVFDSRIVADVAGTRVEEDEEAQSRQPGKRRPRWRRRLVIGL